jgi:hypothetical protein
VCRSQSHVCAHTSTDLQRSYCCFNDHIEDEHMYTDWQQDVRQVYVVWSRTKLLS